MLKTDREKATCAKYSQRDDLGYVHCNDCPLQVTDHKADCMCKANSHYDRHRREWVPDYWEENNDIQKSD